MIGSVVPHFLVRLEAWVRDEHEVHLSLGASLLGEVLDRADEHELECRLQLG